MSLNFKIFVTTVFTAVASAFSAVIAGFTAVIAVFTTVASENTDKRAGA